MFFIFPGVLRFPPPIKLTTYDIAEILLKVALKPCISRTNIMKYRNGDWHRSQSWPHIPTNRRDDPTPF